MAVAAPSPSPMNLLVLGALGIGVYWFMTRSRTGTPVIYPTPAQNQQAYGSSADATKAMKYQLFGGLLNKGLDYLGNKASSPYALNSKDSSFGFDPSGGSLSGLNVAAYSDGLAWNPSGNTQPSSIYSLI